MSQPKPLIVNWPRLILLIRHWFEKGFNSGIITFSPAQNFLRRLQFCFATALFSTAFLGVF